MADIIKVNTVTLKNDTEDIKTRLSNISQKVQSPRVTAIVAVSKSASNFFFIYYSS